MQSFTVYSYCVSTNISHYNYHLVSWLKYISIVTFSLLHFSIWYRFVNIINMILLYLFSKVFTFPMCVGTCIF